MRRLSAEVILLVTVVLWALNVTAVKYGISHGFAPLSYASVRFGLAALIFSALTHRREGTLRVERRDIWLLGAMAALGVWLNQVCLVYSLRLTTASTVSLVFGTFPVFVALCSMVSGIERLRRRHWLATLVSFAGVALVAGGATGGLTGHLGGVLLALALPATWAMYSVAVGPLMRRYSPYRLSAVVLAMGAVPLLASASGQLAGQDWGNPGALAWAALVYSVVLALVLSNVLWFTAIERVGAARSSLYANFQPFLGAVFALVILSEDLGPLQIAGGVVIGAGILIARERRTAIAIE